MSSKCGDLPGGDPLPWPQSFWYLVVCHIQQLALETSRFSLCGQMQYKENHLSEKLNLKIGFKILFNITPGILIEACVSTKSWFGKYPGLCCCIGPECKLWSKGRSKENSVTIYVLSATMEANNPCEVVSLYCITKFMFCKESTMDDILLKHFIRQEKYRTHWNVLEIQDDLKNQTSFLRFQNWNGASYPTR